MGNEDYIFEKYEIRTNDIVESMSLLDEKVRELDCFPFQESFQEIRKKTNNNYEPVCVNYAYLIGDITLTQNGDFKPPEANGTLYIQVASKNSIDNVVNKIKEIFPQIIEF